jgi:hypothetical protein
MDFEFSAKVKTDDRANPVFSEPANQELAVPSAFVAKAKVDGFDIAFWSVIWTYPLLTLAAQRVMTTAPVPAPLPH